MESECKVDTVSLPDEIVVKILSYSTPLDVICARLTSKRFRDITYDRELWKTLYANAPLPRPPGPFPFQSAQYLERILVQSARLAQSWTTQPLEEISSKEVSLEPLQRAPPKIICGKWVFQCHPFEGTVALKDITRPFRKVIWEGSGLMVCSDVFSITTPETELVYIIVCNPTPTLQCKFLEFRVSGDSLEFSCCVDFPGCDFLPDIIQNRGGPFLYLEELGLAFDTRTRTTYEFPRAADEPQGLNLIHPPHGLGGNCRAFLTNAHIILVAPSRTLKSTDIVQAWTIPTPPQVLTDGRCTLRLTHEYLSTKLHMERMTLIRDCLVDPLTGATNIRFLGQFLENDLMQFRCIDLTLHESDDGAIGPISVDIHDVFTIVGPFSPPDSQGRDSGLLFVTASYDGHARGFYQNSRIAEGDPMPRSFTTKFTIDASGDKCEAVISERSPRNTPTLDDNLSSTASFDGVRGTLCCGKPFHEAGYVAAHIVYIK